ncbi:MAG TPA: IS200/IS605 family transposase [Candidatus Limnocylindria bacterium]|nr:IS200/IS605 family transposase [Candidatus Limnocylindria bacterium]
MKLGLAPELNAAVRVRWEPVYRSRLHYLVSWATRGRKPVLRHRHVQALQELIPALCEEREIELVELAIAQDHLHVLFGLRPAHSVASAVREMKGRSGVALLERYPELRVWLGGNLVWDERYAVETVSPARLARVRARLGNIHRPLADLARAS